MAATYIATTACLVLLSYIAGRERHQSDEGVDVFRYPRVITKGILVTAVVFPVAGAFFVYGTFHQKPRGGELALYFGFGV